LDFDGVLHPVSSISNWAADGRPLRELRYDADKQLFRWLDQLAEMLQPYPEIAILVHSGWRTMSRDFELREYLGSLGERFIGSTPLVKQRHAGIEHVLGRIGVTDFVILDDATHEFPKGLPELIATDPELGITEAGVRAQLQTWLDNPKEDQSYVDRATTSPSQAHC
jgi:hypothetical protein